MKHAKRWNYKHYIRKAHRYLGFFIGIQFILWATGGLYFSWTDLDQIHGDHLRAHGHSLPIPAGMVSPSGAVDRLAQEFGPVEVATISVVEILGKGYYAIEYLASGNRSTLLAGIDDGAVRRPITEDEARTIAQSALSNSGEIKEISYLTADNVSKHHEYREKPLPAWGVTFERGVNVYLSAETGQIGAIRTSEWRMFDFLWMLHTMDFQGRDNINNYVLRAFSLLGIVTVLSGFSLFFVSSRFFRRLLQPIRH